MDALITTANGRTRLVPLTTIRVSCHLGGATLRYLTSDGFAGLHIDGDSDRRVEEIALAYVVGLPTLAAA